MEATMKSNSLRLIYLAIFIFTIIMPCLSQGCAGGHFYKYRAKVVLTIFNLSDTTLILPNSFTQKFIDINQIKMDVNIMEITMTHDSFQYLLDTISQGGSILTEQGISRFERITPGEHKKYIFKIPQLYRRLKKIDAIYINTDQRIELLFYRIR